MGKSKEEIEAVLSQLVGQPLVDMTRAADTGIFGFGEKKRGRSPLGRERMVESYSLHVQCPWRIVASDGIVVGSRDIYFPAGEGSQLPDDFEWDVAGANRCDERTERFLDSLKTPLIVESIGVDRLGGVVIQFQEEMRLEIVPDCSLSSELWRFFEPGRGKEHFIVGGTPSRIS